MNKFIKLDTHNLDLENELAALAIGDQLTIDRGDYVYRHLCGMPLFTEQLEINTATREHVVSIEVIKPALVDNTLVGWEIGKINKTRPSCTEYNLIGMLMSNGTITFIRPARTAISLRNGNAKYRHTHADKDMCSKASVVALGGMFTDTVTLPHAERFIWNQPALQIPTNAVRVFHLVMRDQFDLVENIKYPGEIRGLLTQHMN